MTRTNLQPTQYSMNNTSALRQSLGASIAIISLHQYHRLYVFRPHKLYITHHKTQGSTCEQESRLNPSKHTHFAIVSSSREAAIHHLISISHFIDALCGHLLNSNTNRALLFSVDMPSTISRSKSVNAPVKDPEPFTF